MNNLNCHPEDIEGSQPLHISPRNIAENAKLNHEIAEELKKQSSMSCQCPTLASRWLRKPYLTWILRSSRSMTRMYVLLSIITLLPTLAQAETCTATPDCASLSYTQSSCPDGGGVKCPWNTSLLYCGKKCPDCPSCPACNSCCPSAPAYPTCESKGLYSRDGSCNRALSSMGCINGGCAQFEVKVEEDIYLSCVRLECWQK